MTLTDIFVKRLVVDLIPDQIEAVEVFAEAVGIVAGRFALAGCAKEDSARFREGARFAADFDHVG